MAGKASHGVSFIDGIRVLIILSLTVQLIHQKYKVILPQFLPIQQWSFSDPHNCLASLSPYLLKLPSLFLDLRLFIPKRFSVVVGQIAFIISRIGILLRGADEVLQEQRFLGGCVLVDQEQKALEVDQDESVLEVAQDVADLEGSSMKDGVTCLLCDRLELVLAVPAAGVLGHVLWKLVTLGPRLHF